MNTCKKCAHWKRYFQLAGEKNPNNAVFVDDVEAGVAKKIGACLKLASLVSDTPEEDMIDFNGSDEYEPAFDTGENFGCIHWEERP